MDWAKSKALVADKKWRLRNLYTISNKKGKLCKFVPNGVQEEFYSNLWWSNYVLKSRQHGLSTFTAILFLDRLLFEPDKKAGMIDYKLDDGKKKLAMMKLAYEHLDDQELHPDTWGIGHKIKERVQLIKGMDSPFPEELVFSNGSSVYTSTTMRGGTIQYLHVSEYGKISLSNPSKAIEIVEGAENALHEGSICIYETTHEGGRTGKAYELCKQSMGNPRDINQLTRLDARFHFFPWFLDEANTMPPEEAEKVGITVEMQEYFAKVEEDATVPKLTTGQKAWFVKKKVRQGDGMLKEHPTTPEEAFMARIHGAIYGDLVAKARNEGRICNFPVAKEPIYAFFDLGISDSTTIILGQFVGQEIRLIDSKEDTGEGIEYYGHHLKRWQQEHDRIVEALYLPHDGGSRQLSTGKSLADSLREMGFVVDVVPRTASIWTGVNYLREIFPRFWLNKDKLEAKWHDGSRERASFIDCVEAYRTKPEEPGKQSTTAPIHDEYSHMCDALRTMGDAIKLGMVNKLVRTRMGRARASLGNSMK